MYSSQEMAGGMLTAVRPLKIKNGKTTIGCRNESKTNKRGKSTASGVDKTGVDM